MYNRKWILIEKLVIALMAVMMLVAYVLFYIVSPESFRVYVQEDGIVEWLTVVGLICGVAVCVSRFFKLRTSKNWWFLTVTLGIALMLFFGAGEEISWGQRIFGIKSSEFFIEHNAQHETNLHNLIVDGIKINKLVFSAGLVIFLVIYLLFFPLFYNRSAKFKAFIDNSGIPIPQVYQSAGIAILYGLTELIRDDKRPELLEAGAAFFFFLIILQPVNKSIFTKNGR